jgi:Ca-activated chloride channel family protein
MSGSGTAQLNEAMRGLLNQDIARQNLLAAGERDENVFVLFNGGIIKIFSASGNDPKTLGAAFDEIASTSPSGGTNIYLPIAECLRMMERYNAEDYITAIILMTDGKSDDYYDEFSRLYRASGMDVPVFSIMFGSSNPDQLNGLAELTRARVFDGKADLTGAFRTAKGYN